MTPGTASPEPRADRGCRTAGHPAAGKPRRQPFAKLTPEERTHQGQSSSFAAMKSVGIVVCLAGEGRLEDANVRTRDSHSGRSRCQFIRPISITMRDQIAETTRTVAAPA